MRVALKSPCKVNFILNILGKRPDGFHELETVIHPVPVFDVLSFSRTDSGVHLTCSQPGLPVDSSNLVHRAATRFLEAAKIRDGARIHLEKRIPLAAGLGGGSSNAAKTLLGLNELFEFPLRLDELARLASELGSDVPFFLQDRPALATGRGENVLPLEPFPFDPRTRLVLIHPGFGVPTPWAYKNLARFPAALNGERGRAARLIDRLRVSIEAAKADFYNSLEAPVLEKYPLLAIFQEFLRENGAIIAMMSGSGSSTFALIDSPEAAEKIIERFRSKFGNFCWIESVPPLGLAGPETRPGTRTPMSLP